MTCNIGSSPKNALTARVFSPPNGNEWNKAIFAMLPEMYGRDCVLCRQNPTSARCLGSEVYVFLNFCFLLYVSCVGADYQEELAKYISSDQIPKEYGGTASFDVPSLMSLSDAVKANIIPGSVLWADVSEQKKLMPNAEALKSAP